MNHSFSVEIATEHGLQQAVLIENLAFWIKKNIANGAQLHQGLCYTYNSAAAFAELFPYMNAKKIAHYLGKLREDSVIDAQKLSKDPRNRTLYYAILCPKIANHYGIMTDYHLQKVPTKSAEKGELHFPYLGNAIPKFGKCYTDINTTDINIYKNIDSDFSEKNENQKIQLNTEKEKGQGETGGSAAANHEARYKEFSERFKSQPHTAKAMWGVGIDIEKVSIDDLLEAFSINLLTTETIHLEYKAFSSHFLNKAVFTAQKIKQDAERKSKSTTTTTTKYNTKNLDRYAAEYEKVAANKKILAERRERERIDRERGGNL